MATGSLLEETNDDEASPAEETTYLVPAANQDPTDLFPVESLVVCNPQASEEDKIYSSVEECLELEGGIE